jgi:hypothetical protein
VILAHVSLTDLAGLAGVLIIIAAYAGAQLRRLDPIRAPSLLMNFGGACMIILSLLRDFNLSAFLMEAAWALVALFGLIRIALTRR